LFHFPRPLAAAAYLIAQTSKPATTQPATEPGSTFLRSPLVPIRAGVFLVIMIMRQPLAQAPGAAEKRTC